jgi:uncharacterized protein YxeA
MKKLILLLTIITLLYSCSSDSNSNSNNPSNGNVNYYFKIKINGVEHKVQGNTSGFAVGNINVYNQNPNNCYASIGTTTSLFFTIADITKPNYISGQTLQLIVQIPNCHLGLNQADVINLTSPVFSDFYSNSGSNSSGIFVENSGLYCGGPLSLCQYPLWQSFTNKITINITDLGTPTESNSTTPSINLINYGNTFKGSFNGPIYYGTSSTSSGVQVFNMNIPMQFSMEFEAYRVN